ncbi:penicillin-insensitive murein endopeptidase, partial [bacterium]|nr:penicillin-insensitive murein endopeptidase [bacterium]
MLGVAVLFAIATNGSIAQDRSTCYGTTSDGSLTNGWKLPLSGQNFASYSTIGSMVGRTYVHSDVYEVLLESYRALESSASGKVFVYGETGKRDGGSFEPHKTHRNGLSVDFMVPVVDRSGDSVPLPTNVLNKWGYDIEFDSNGQFDNLMIDAEAMAEHIYQLHRVAEERGIGIWRVIFAPELQPLLHSTPRWSYLREHMQFSERRSWVRHDEHY